MTVMIASEVHSNASRSLTQPLLDCILYLTHFLYIQALYQALQIRESVSEIQSIKERVSGVHLSRSCAC